MKRFGKNILLFIGPLLLAGLSAEFLLERIPNNYQFKYNALKKNSDSLQVLFLGSSHAYYDINPDYIKEHSFNAAYLSQTLDLDYGILEKFHGKNLKTVVIPLSYFSLNTILEERVDNWRIRNYVVDFGLKKDLPFYKRPAILGYPFKENLTRLTDYYLKHKPAVTCTASGWGLGYSFDTKIKDLSTAGKIAADRHTGMNPVIFKKVSEILQQIITFSKSNNITVLFYTPPAYNTYVQQLEEKQLSQLLNMGNTLAKNNANVFYVNMLNDSSFTARDFYDADHLDDTGAVKMSIKLDSMINRLKKIPAVKQSS